MQDFFGKLRESDRDTLRIRRKTASERQWGARREAWRQREHVEGWGMLRKKWGGEDTGEEPTEEVRGERDINQQAGEAGVCTHARRTVRRKPHAAVPKGHMEGDGRQSDRWRGRPATGSLPAVRLTYSKKNI